MSSDPALTLMLLIGNKMKGIKNGTNPLILDLSHQVTQLVQNSNHLLEDLKLLEDVLAA